jgi:nucleotide-binding universal stress UspA family protein
MGIMSVVVGIDGSEPSLHALSFSIGLAVREQARLSACFVSHQVVPFGVGILPMDYEDYAKQLEQLVNEEFERADVGGSFFYREGDVALELKRLADECAADLIVVGRSRHPLIHIGSVPKRLLDDSRHAVLIVP